MRFKSLHLRNGLETGSYEFSDVTVIFSHHNQVGKTTLVRALLYALGYPIPSTRGIKFERMEFTLVAEKEDGAEIVIERSFQNVNVKSGTSCIRFTLPYEQTSLLECIFGVKDQLILNSLLGCCYLDQEKGWTLLNRGKVIGSIQFTIEDLMRGLSGNPCIEEYKNLSTINEELKKFQQLESIAEYQAGLDLDVDLMPYDSSDEEILIEQVRLKNQRHAMLVSLKRMEEVMRQNLRMKKFISTMCIRVKATSGEVVPVNEDTIIGLKENERLLAAKCKEKRVAIAEIENLIGKLDDKLSERNQLVTVRTSIQESDLEISRIKIDKLAIENRIKGLRKRQKDLKERIARAVGNSGSVTKNMTDLVIGYLRDFNVEEKFGRDIYTHDLKSLTGASFHLLVFAFRMAYVQIIKRNTGLRLPFVIDSPNGREVEPCHIDKMMNVLRRDFADHQVVMATIFDPRIVGGTRIVLTNGVVGIGNEQAANNRP